MGVIRQSIRVFYGTVYTLLGIAGFFTFIVFQNYVSSCLGFVTAVTNAILTQMHILALRRVLRQWYDDEQLTGISRFSYVVLCAGAMCCAYFAAMEVMLKRAIVPVSESLVIPIIWSFITMKSACTLLYYCHFYGEERYLEEPARPPLDLPAPQPSSAPTTDSQTAPLTQYQELEQPSDANPEE